MFRTLVVSLVLTIAAGPVAPVLCSALCTTTASLVLCHESTQTVLVPDACDHEVAAVALALRPGTDRDVAAAQAAMQIVADAVVAERSGGDPQGFSSERPPGTRPPAGNLRI